VGLCTFALNMMEILYCTYECGKGFFKPVSLTESGKLIQNMPNDAVHVSVSGTFNMDRKISNLSWLSLSPLLVKSSDFVIVVRRLKSHLPHLKNCTFQF